MDTLLHHPHVSFTSSQSKIFAHLPASLSLLSHPIPCKPFPSVLPSLTALLSGDIFMLNLRSDLSRPKSAGILHRRGYDCTFTSTPEWCQTSNGTVCGQNVCYKYMVLILLVGGVESTVYRGYCSHGNRDVPESSVGEDGSEWCQSLSHHPSHGDSGLLSAVEPPLAILHFVCSMIVLNLLVF